MSVKTCSQIYKNINHIWYVYYDPEKISIFEPVYHESSSDVSTSTTVLLTLLIIFIALSISILFVSIGMLIHEKIYNKMKITPIK